MEISNTLDILQNTFINSATLHDKNLALQQKFIYVLHKREFIEYHIKYQLYLEALIYMTQALYSDSHKQLKNYVNYFESLIF
jgi:hypothetical protein